MSHRRERALVKRHQLFSIKHRRKPLPRTGRPPLYVDPDYRTAEQLDALRLLTVDELMAEARRNA